MRVRPTWFTARCGTCGRRCRGGAVATEGREWRHLDMAGFMVFLRSDVRRVYCRRCGETGVERLPWASDARSRFTPDFDDHVAFLAQRCVTIGVDEISYRKHHHYLTLVADQVEGRIVWGKAAATPRRSRRSSTSSAASEPRS